MPATKIIEYIDATPAAGKTREARRLIYHHIATEAKHIIVYAAPTHKLIAEVMDSLVDAMMRGTPEDLVVCIKPGAKAAPALQYSYLMGLVEETTAKTGLPPETFAYLRRMRTKCRVILCTHACLISATKGESKRSQSATIIFDEARNCVLKDLEMTVSKAGLSNIAKVFNLRRAGTEQGIVKVNGESFQSTLFTLDSESFPTKRSLLNKFGVGDLIDLPDYVRNLYSMKATCAGGRADVLVETFKPLDPGSKHKAYIVGLSRPSSIFEGYGRVIVMSAYFTHSQMYHMLLNAHVGHQSGAQSFTLVPYKTSKEFSIQSEAITKNSLEKIRIGALLKGTRSGRLTAAFLSSGLVVTPSVNQALKDRAKLKKAEVIEYAFSRKEVPGLTDSENSMLWACANPPLLALHKLAYEVFSQNRIKAALCFTNAVGSSGVGATYKIAGTKVVDTVDFIKSSKYALREERYMEQRRYITEAMQFHLSTAANKIVFTVPDSTSVLGLNSYDHLNGYVHLAALNPRPSVARMLKRVLPNYEPDLDYAISNIVQTMYRTSLRKKGSDVRVVCLVLTEWIIEQIERVCFGGEKLKRVEGYEPRFTELDYSVQDTEAKSRGGKAGGEARRLVVPSDVKKQMQKLQNGAKTASRTLLKRKILGLQKIAAEWPEVKQNVERWVAKYS